MDQTNISAVQQKVSHFFRNYPKLTLTKDQIVILRNEPPDGIYYLVRGRIRQYDITLHGDDVIVNVFKPGAFFPMSWAISQTPNKYLFKAEIDSEAYVAPPTDVLEFLKSNPDVALDLLDRLYRGMDGVLGRLVQLMGHTAGNRLAYELLIEAKRFGQPQGGAVRLSLNQSDLAAHAGLSRETVSREISKLKQLGLVNVVPQGLDIPNLQALEQFVEANR